MDLKEACEIFSLPKTADESEFKARHRQFVKDFHPDFYKDDPNKLSKINQAYDIIKDYKSNPNKYDNPNPFGGGFPGGSNPFQGFGINFEDLFGGFGQTKKPKRYQRQPVSVDISISFDESVLGIEKELEYARFMKCDACNGEGEIRHKNDCKKCDGFGKSTVRQGNMIMQSICQDCSGKGIKTQQCKCMSEGAIRTQHKVKVNIPAGIKNDTLRLHNAGHYITTDVFQGDLYSDVFLNVKVIKDPDMSLVDKNVVSTLKLSLLDALTGCEREIRTVYGNRTIAIPAKSKHKEDIRIKGCGVKGSNGDHIVSLFTEYPENVEELINVLKVKEN